MSFVMSVLRSSDLLNLQLEFINLRIDESGARPVIRRESADAFIALRLPPQYVAEQVVVEGGALTAPYQALLSGPTRLTFRLPGQISEIPLKLEDILSLVTRLPPWLPTEPLAPDAATVIEFPDRLLLVPESGVRLHHRPEPPQRDRIWTELWQTRLHDDSGKLRLKAVKNPRDRERLSPATLRLQDRLDIVKRSQSEPSGPHVLVAEQFILSTLGASVKLRSAWTDASTATTLSAWNHDAALGRDRNVRTVREGFLFPFGHRAAIETLTWRNISFGAPPIAELRQRNTLTLREEEKTYSSREMPFRRVQLTALPRRIARGEHDVYEVDATIADARGNAINCVLKALFVELGEATGPGAPPKLERIFQREYKDRHDTLDLGYRRVVLAETPDERGGTDFDVASLKFGVDILQVGEAGPLDPLFRPIMETARVSIPAIEQLQGLVGGTSNRAVREPTAIKLSRRYLDQGLDPRDTKQVFAEIVDPIEGLAIPPEKAGGIAAPKFPKMDGLSRLMGPVSDVRNFAGQDTAPVDAAQLIGNTKLLGTIVLKDIVDIAQTSDMGFLASNPESLFDKVKIEAEPGFILRRPVITTVRTGAEIETRFVWKPKIMDVLPGGLLRQRDPPSGIEDPARPPGKMQLIVKGRMKVAPAAEKADLQIEGRLTNFVLSLAGLLNVEFNEIEFLSRAGRKMEVKTAIAKVSFQGALAFAEEIRKAIPIAGLGGASIDPQPDGVVARYSLALPAIPLGVLSLQNIAFISSVSLPFVEKPVGVRFALSERGNPFIVSVAPFGGTGFFALEMRTSGPDALLVEAAIEFGGIVTFNLLGIVKGGVYVLAGVYMAIRSGAGPEISAHLRIGGFVDVLGLISVSIELYLALEFRNERLSGTARLTIGVKVLFFSKSFSFEVHKEIAHLGGTPRDAAARQLMDQSQWKSYCAAFA